MRIIPVTPQNKQNKQIYPNIKPVVMQQPSNSVSFLGQVLKVFEKIKLPEAEVLYNTKAVLSGERMGEKCLSTFVLDKKGNPIELFIRTYKPSNNIEHYEMWIPETPNTLYCDKLVGFVWLKFHPNQKTVEPWCITAYDENLRGVKFRCLQLAQERRIMEKYKKIILQYDRDNHDFYSKAGLVQKRYGGWGLPLGTIRELKKFIDEQPILIGKNLEEFLYKGNCK